MTNAIGDFREAIGRAIAPAKTAWNLSIKSMAEKATLFVSQNEGIIRGVAKLGKMLFFIGTAVAALGAFFFWLTSPISIAVTLLVVAVASVLQAFGVIDLGIGELMESIKIKGLSLKGWWDVFVQSLLKAWHWLMEKMLGAAEWIVGKLETVYGGLMDTWMVFLKNIGQVSEEDLNKYFDQKAESAGQPSAVRQWLANQKGDYAASVAGDNQALQDIVDQDVARQGKKGSIWDRFKKGWAPGVKAPALDYFRELSAPTVPGKSGVTGMFGGANFRENLGGLSGNVDQQQLSELKNIGRTLKDIKSNTESMEATYA